MLRRPTVLATIVAIIQIHLILAFPKHIIYIFVGFIALIAICLPICIKTKKLVIPFILLPTLLICVATSYFTYEQYENTSERLISVLQDKENVQYTAVVDECRVYSGYSQIFATLQSVNGITADIPLRARLNCYSGLQLADGDTIVFQGKPISVRQIENDGFDTTSYLRSKRIFIDFPSASIIKSIGAEKTPLLSKLRDYTYYAMYKYIPQNSNYETAALSYAMFAGDRNLIPNDIKDSFSECGLTHILCVSGMHLAILSGICYCFLSMFSVHKKLKCAIIITLCVFYTAFTGFSLSTVRACIMCVISYIGMMSGRKTDAYISLFFSLLVICIFSPYSVLDISLILSFCATLGIICLSEFAPLPTEGGSLRKFVTATTQLILSNLGAVMFTLPVCAASFGGISLMSVAATMAVSFIFEVLLLCLLFLLLLSPLSFFSAIDIILDIIGNVCHLFCLGIIKASDFFSHFRYATISSAFPETFLALFVCALILLSVFIAFDFVLARRFCIAAIVTLGVIFSFISLMFSVADDNVYKITYYRKNVNDRQLCIKLGTQGHLLVNADNRICGNKDDAPFDYKYKNNYLFIVPDDAIIPAVLSQNIKIFDNRFGLKNVYVPKSKEGAELASELDKYGIRCNYISSEATVEDITIKYTADDYFYLSVDDGNTKTGILFDDKYNPALFDKNCDICAFFTRNTKTQFDTNKDIKPVCSKFFTRLKKGEEADGIINTYGEKTVVIKG